MFCTTGAAGVAAAALRVLFVSRTADVLVKYGASAKPLCDAAAASSEACFTPSSSLRMPSARPSEIKAP